MFSDSTILLHNNLHSHLGRALDPASFSSPGHIGEPNHGIMGDLWEWVWSVVMCSTEHATRVWILHYCISWSLL